MLFRKKHPRVCSYCTNGTQLDNGLILCIKKGVRASDDGCRKFSYDPCKRVPPKPKSPNFDDYSQEDFTL